MPRFARPALALSLLVLAAPPVLTADAGLCLNVKPAGLDGWSTAYPDAFSAGGSKITVLAAAPRHPDTVLITNGAAVQRTADAGCTWSPVALPGVDVLGAVGSTVGGSRYVSDIEIGPVRSGTEPVWVLAQEGGALPHPSVFRSTDGGVTFAASGLGLPPTGRGQLLAASPDPAVAYVVVDLPSPAGRRLFVTRDGGGTWSASTNGDTFGYDGLLVDTVSADQLWAWTADGLAESFDGGGTFAPVHLPVKTPVRDVALGQAPRGSRVAVLLDGGTLLRSDDAGVTWSRRTVDDGADTVTAAPDLDVAAVAGPGVVTILPSIFTPIDASPLGENPVELTIGLLPKDEVRLVGRGEATVLMHEGTVLRGLNPATLIDLHAPSLVIPIEPALVPRKVTVTLAPGQTQDVDYEFDVPATPTPIDVFFLIDTTGSMGGVIDGVRTGLARIVNDLSAAGIPAQFGVGEVKDYPFESWGNVGDLPYRLFRKIGPVNDELRDALQQLQATGGGDEAEAMTTGLFQMAAGRGQVLQGQTMVPRGDDAGFRPGALRIAVQSTDAPFHVEPNYPGPPLTTVYTALRAAHVRVMGLSASARGRADLAATALATDTRAPAGGVDCNADGVRDLDAGDPLVCDIAGSTGTNVSIGIGPIKIDTGATAGISSSIIALLRGIKDPATLALTSSTPDVVKVLGPQTVGVDLKLPHAEPFRVRLACPPARYGQTVDAVLSGAAAARTLATGAVTVNCLAPVVPQDEPEPAAARPPRPPVAAAAAPPAPPPAPAQNVQPNAQGNPNPHAQLQAGAAQQRQEQLQLALAAGDFEPGDAVQLAMSDHRRMPDTALPATAGLMFAVAASSVLRTRRARALGVARARS